MNINSAQQSVICPSWHYAKVSTVKVLARRYKLWLSTVSASDTQSTEASLFTSPWLTEAWLTMHTTTFSRLPVLYLAPYRFSRLLVYINDKITLGLLGYYILSKCTLQFLDETCKESLDSNSALSCGVRVNHMPTRPTAGHKHSKTDLGL